MEATHMIDKRSLEVHPDPGYQALLRALHKRQLSGEPVASIADLARALDLTRQAVSRWARVPPRHVLTVEALTGVSRHVLRPDIYPRQAPDKPKKAKRRGR